MPKTVKEAIEIDKSNGNTLWQDSIRDEMENVMVAFVPLKEGEKVPAGSEYMECHMVFDIKLEMLGSDHQHKSQLVAGGHMTTIDYN